MNLNSFPLVCSIYSDMRQEENWGLSSSDFISDSDKEYVSWVEDKIRRGIATDGQVSFYDLVMHGYRFPTSSSTTSLSS